MAVANSESPPVNLETLAIHAGLDADPSGSVAPPIYLSTTYARRADGEPPDSFFYARTDNPNRAALEARLAALEGGAVAAAFGSGSAATMTVFQVLAPGDHVIAPNDAYYNTAQLLRGLFEAWGLQASFVDMTDLDQVRAALRPTTRLIWVETPSNPLLRVTDIAGVVALARSVGARVVVDNTWATPVLQRPLALGADIAMHSTTKYLGGHADVTGGALVAREDDDFFQRIRFIQRNGGPVPSPFDCWLLLRGISTLPLRMRAHTEHATRVVAFLAEHPRIEAVHYPGLASHPQHAVAARQMSGFGGMAAIQVRGGRAAALRVAAGVRLFIHATSLGGVESLIEHRQSIEGPATRTPDNLLRLSIGLEHADDLIADLAQALATA